MVLKDLDVGVIDVLVAARKKLKLSQSSFAKTLGIPQSYISRLESGQVDLRLSTLVQFARYFNFEIVLVPHDLAPVVKSLIGAGTVDLERPMYRLEDIDCDED